MSGKILQINFKFNISAAELAEGFAPLAEPIAQAPGLRWKIWTINEAENEAGGIYFFNDESSLDAFLNGPLAEQVKSHPAFSDMSAKPFDVMPEPTATCRGPV